MDVDHSGFENGTGRSLFENSPFGWRNASGRATSALNPRWNRCSAAAHALRDRRASGILFILRIVLRLNGCLENCSSGNATAFRSTPTLPVRILNRCAGVRGECRVQTARLTMFSPWQKTLLATARPSSVCIRPRGWKRSDVSREASPTTSIILLTGVLLVLRSAPGQPRAMPSRTKVCGRNQESWNAGYGPGAAIT